MTKNEESGNLLSTDKQTIAKKNAEDILKRIKSGEDIEKLAPELTEDPNVKEVGGCYSISKENSCDEPQLQKWAFSSKVDDVGLVKTHRGYYVTKKTHEYDYEEQKESAREDFIEKIIIDEMNKEKNKAENIVIKNEDIYNKLDY